MKHDPLEYLKRLGEDDAGPRHIARGADAGRARSSANFALDPYLAHLQEMEEAMKAKSDLILRADDGARAVAGLVAGRLGYEGDRLEYDNPRNADLISVIDRRRGLPVALGILYIHAARAAGLRAAGLNTHSHFVLRLSHRGDDTIIDPFNGGATVDRDHLPVELRAGDAGLAEPVSDTDVLLRLQNNLKMRAGGWRSLSRT